jgi:hypothetical protein
VTLTYRGFPPTTTLEYVAENADEMPGYLAYINDSSYWTQVTRVNNVSGQRHRYATKAAWNCDETLLILDYPPGGSGTSRAILDGNTYAVLQATNSTGGYFTWSNLDPNEAWNYSGLAIQRLYVDATGITVANSYTLTALTGTYHSIHLGGGQGSISDDDLYLSYAWRKTNEDHGVGVFRTTDQTIISEYLVGNAANPGALYSALVAHGDAGTVGDVVDATGMSPSGDYVVIAMGVEDGTGAYQGTWIIDRDGTNARNVASGRVHFDIGRNAANEDMLVMPSQSLAGGSAGTYLGTYRCSDLAWTPLLDFWESGHVSTRNTQRPGWIYCSTFDQSGSWDGFHSILALNMDEPTKVQMFADVHGPTAADAAYSSYATEPHACPSPSGTRVIFASRWGGSDIYSFVAGQADFSELAPVPTTRVLWRPGQYSRVTNTGFETNTTGWLATAGINAAATSITRITTDYWSGTACASVVCTSTLNSGVNWDFGSDRFYSEASYGTVYTAEVRMKRVSGSRRARITLGSLGTSSDRATRAITELTDAWETYSLRWMPTADRTDVELAIMNDSEEAITFLVDHVYVFAHDAFSQVENGSFEVDTTGWLVTAGTYTAAGTSITRTSGTFGGSWCARVVTTSTSTSGAKYVLGSRVWQSGRTYRVRFAAKTVSGSADVAWKFGYDSTDKATGSSTLTTTWTWYTLDWSPSATRTSAEFGIYTSTAAIATFDIDEVEVYEAADDIAPHSMRWNRVIGSGGTINVRVNSAAGEYDPRNTTGALYEAIEPGKRIWSRGVYGGRLLPLFYGTITSIEAASRNGIHVDLNAEDMMADIARAQHAAAFTADLTYRDARAQVIASVLANDERIETTTKGSSRYSLTTNTVESNMFYGGTDDTVGALDYLDDLNEATQTAHFVAPSPHANIGWVYTTIDRATLTDGTSDWYIDDDFVDLTGVRLSHDALENRQAVPWQGYAGGPFPADETSGVGTVLVARATSTYGTSDDQDPYLHHTNDAYGDNNDVPEPTYRITRRWRKRRKGRKVVKVLRSIKHRYYPGGFVPIRMYQGDVLRVECDFAIPMEDVTLTLADDGVYSGAVVAYEVERSPTRYVVDLIADGNVRIVLFQVKGRPWTPYDEQEEQVNEPGARLVYPGPGWSTPYIPSKGDARGVGRYRNWRYGDARLTPTVVLGVGQIVIASQVGPTDHVTLAADAWRINDVLHVVRGVTVDVTENARRWDVAVDLEELPTHTDWFTLDDSAKGLNDAVVLAY